MEFSGYIKAVRYKNEENGYTVASMETEDGDINIVGYFSYVDKGEYVKIFGELTYSDKYGELNLILGQGIHVKLVNNRGFFPASMRRRRP